MTLVRSILLHAIDQEGAFANGNPAIDGHTENEIAFHVYLMKQAGLVEAINRTLLGAPGPAAILQSVTWDGYEFADAAKDAALWRKATGSILNDGASFTFELLKEWLRAEARTRLGLP